MSSTSLYELFKTKANSINKLQNSFGSGIALWNYISLKVLNEEFHISNNNDDFWHCYKSDKLDDQEKIVLLATYDKSFIEVEHLIEFSAACRNVHKLIIDTTNWDWSHFEAIGQAAEKLYKNHHHRCKGMAIGCTSVCDIWLQEDVKNIDAWGVYAHLKSIDEL